MILGLQSVLKELIAMATKGASNRYGNARGGHQVHKTKRIGFAWAKDFNKKTLLEHFEKHGSQMSSDTVSSYAAHAVKFANTIDRENCVRQYEMTRRKQKK